MMPNWSQKVREHFNQASKAYGFDNVWVTMCYGSQNYGMATENSDMDVKTMLFPTVRATVLGEKTVSTDLVLSDGSLNGVKDYRDTFKLYLRGNVRFLETLYTDFYVVNPNYNHFFESLRASRELVANSLPRKLMHSAAGMAEQKYKALDHPFPSKLEVLARYGYDPKQLHHLARLYYFMNTFMQTLSYGKSLVPSEGLKKMLMGFKVDPLSKHEAFDTANYYRMMVQDLVKKVDDGVVSEDNNFKEATDFLNNLAFDLFKYRYSVQE